MHLGFHSSLHFLGSQLTRQVTGINSNFFPPLNTNYLNDLNDLNYESETWELS